MEKTYKSYIKLVYFLLLLLVISFLPFNIKYTKADGYYLISDEQTLKDWLLDTNSVQTNNPSAQITQNINLNWGNVSTYPSIINNGSTLNGNNNTIYLQGFNGTTPGGETYGQIALFVNFISGTLTNVNFEINSEFDIRIHADTAQKNEQLYVGVICGRLENGTVNNCRVNINNNIWFNTDTKGLTNASDASSNHFGVVAGGMWGSAVISNVSVIQQANTTIQLYADQGFAYLRLGMICGDPYKSDQGIPLIKNIYVERGGYIKFKNRGAFSAGGEIFGNVVADLDTGSDGANHWVNIDGVILYLPIGTDLRSGITHNHERRRTDNTRGYIIGATKDGTINYSVQNIYALQNNLQDNCITCVGNGYTYLDTANYNYQFVNDSLQISAKGENQFIWSITRNSTNEKIDVYSQAAVSVLTDKYNVSTSVNKDSLTIENGAYINQATFGFESTEVTYSGDEYKPIFTINGETINSGFSVVVNNNLNSTITSGNQATFDLIYSENPNGIFIHENKYYVAKEDIDFTNTKMTILQKDLDLTYIFGNIYSNSFKIEGLVKDEKITINGSEFSNGLYVLDCNNNDVVKNISFGNGIIETNYSINRNGFEDYQFIVSPFTVNVDQGITITDLDNDLANFENNVLTIYSKDFKTLNLNFAQPEGMLNLVTLENSASKTYDITNSLSDGTMQYIINQYAENDFQFLTNISLKETLKKVVVKIDVQGIEQIENITTANEKEIVKFGDYLVLSSDYNEEITLNVDLKDNIITNYQIKFFVNNQEQTIENNSLTFMAKGDEYNIINIRIVLEEIV